jgi:Tfp pilus assembly protein PilF
VFREEGQLELSIRETDKVLEQDPESLGALGSLARAYLDSGDVTKASATMMRPERPGIGITWSGSWRR